MYFMSEERLRQALKRYATLDVRSNDQANDFFKDFGPGNMIAQVDRPQERFQDYQNLLLLLRKQSQTQYEELHKGTPFCIMSWLAFDARDFEKALVYMDAAISEDCRADPVGWRSTPAGLFLRLKGEQFAVLHRTVPEIRRLLDDELARFVKATGESLAADSFLARFVAPLLESPRTRTIVSHCYVFLLEAEDRYTELCLRSSAGGSLGPAIGLLFRGGLLFESLLKHLYPRRPGGARYKTIGNIFKDQQFCADFVDDLETSADSLADILSAVDGDTMRSAFSTTAKLRNTTGHNLVWDDAFCDPENFRLLVRQELNSLFFVVCRRFGQPS